ncbi:TPA: type-F conjugative transfer system secretin TraK [Providencia rettgeri]|nr:type-F conjugative transfer system secretin TraK [Providencia rettgeri]
MKRRKSKLSQLALLALSLGLFSAFSLAEPAATLPVQIPVSPDSQVRVAFSNSEPNMLVVPGDRIVAIDSAQGMFINGNQKGAGGIKQRVTANAGLDGPNHYSFFVTLFAVYRPTGW